MVSSVLSRRLVVISFQVGSALVLKAVWLMILVAYEFRLSTMSCWLVFATRTNLRSSFRLCRSATRISVVSIDLFVCAWLYTRIWIVLNRLRLVERLSTTVGAPE